MTGRKPTSADSLVSPPFAPGDRRPSAQEIEIVFEEALDVAAGERAAWVAERCRGDEALRLEVVALLAAHEREDTILDAPIAGRVAAVLEDPARGRHIGPYRVLRELGRGGMGVVYLAERDDGQYRQRVAVKVLRSSHEVDELYLRFIAERQILASLSHPNIAQLLDGGLSDGEVPYLVMEYVDGLPITEFCDRHRLDIPARLRLFQDICAAVHHAHQNLVLHRDLKPANVLVTASGQVKLLDFGIAKLLNPSIVSVDQPVTRTAFRLMTPAYASPEQVRGDSLATTSDVYTLGLLLYELLCGSPAHRITTDAPQAIYEAVCVRDPERPSLCAARDDAIAAARATTTERLLRALRGDLDAIVARALRKESAWRYGSAELFAADITRYLEGLPVEAQRGSRGYRFAKLLRRHRTAALFAAMSALLVIGGAVVSLRLASVASRERDRGAQALAQTQRTLRESEAVTRFLVGLFEASDPLEGRADTLTAADLLRRGLARAEQLDREPLVQARLLEALGRVNFSRGDITLAAQLLQRALDVRRAQLGPDHPATAATEATLADVRRRQGQYAAWDSLAREALRVRRRVLGDDHADVAASLVQMSELALNRDDLTEAERYQREAIAVHRRGGRVQDSAMVRDLARFASLLWRRADHVGREQALREAVAVARRAFPGPHREHVFALLRLADMLDEKPGSRAEAESLYFEALKETRAAFGDSHAETGQTMKQVALMLGRHGRAVEGERMLRQALEIQRRTLGPSHPEVAATMALLAELLRGTGYSPEAERLVREAVDATAAVYGTSHPAYAGALGHLADILLARGALDSAEMVYRRVIELRTSALGPQSRLTRVSQVGLAKVFARRRRFAEAEAGYRTGLAALSGFTDDSHRSVRRIYAAMASLYDAWGKPDSAAVYRRRADGVDLRDLWP